MTRSLCLCSRVLYLRHRETVWEKFRAKSVSQNNFFVGKAGPGSGAKTEYIKLFQPFKKVLVWKL